ncbi:MAG: zinc ABC transporter substrate-binding protein [Eubacteriales bacterium]
MKKLLVFFLLLQLVACQKTEEITEDKLNIVATTTMLQDMVWQIAGEQVNLTGLCAVGVDPHSYVPTYEDCQALLHADVVLYHGHFLEGQMGELFTTLEEEGVTVLSLEQGIPMEYLLFEEETGFVDPHLWWDTQLWKLSAFYVAESLCHVDEENAIFYQENLAIFTEQLDELEREIVRKVAEISEEQRVLITAHDAFGYYGKAYGFTVMGIQGINTETEAGTGDISALAHYIAENQIKCIFTETSVSDKSIKALEEAVAAKGFQVKISSDSLFSDSLGGGMNYIETAKANLSHIVKGLI